MSESSANSAAAKARRADLAERAEQLKLLQEILTLKDRGGLSAERASALRVLFSNKNLPSSPETVRKDESDRDNGLLEMSCARFRWLERQKMDELGMQETSEARGVARSGLRRLGGRIQKRLRPLKFHL